MAGGAANGHYDMMRLRPRPLLDPLPYPINTVDLAGELIKYAVMKTRLCDGN